MIRFENYFEGKLTGNYKKGYVLSWLWIKKCSVAVQKYGGVVNVDQKDNWLELKILMPLLKWKYSGF